MWPFHPDSNDEDGGGGGGYCLVIRAYVKVKGLNGIASECGS